MSLPSWRWWPRSGPVQADHMQITCRSHADHWDRLALRHHVRVQGTDVAAKCLSSALQRLHGYSASNIIQQYQVRLWAMRMIRCANKTWTNLLEPVCPSSYIGFAFVMFVLPRSWRSRTAHTCCHCWNGTSFVASDRMDSACPPNFTHSQTKVVRYSSLGLRQTIAPNTRLVVGLQRRASKSKVPSRAQQSVESQWSLSGVSVQFGVKVCQNLSSVLISSLRLNRLNRTTLKPATWEYGRPSLLVKHSFLSWQFTVDGNRLRFETKLQTNGHWRTLIALQPTSAADKQETCSSENTEFLLSSAAYELMIWRLHFFVQMLETLSLWYSWYVVFFQYSSRRKTKSGYCQRWDSQVS